MEKYIEMGKICFNRGVIPHSLSLSLLENTTMRSVEIISLRVKGVGHLAFSDPEYVGQDFQHVVNLTTNPFIKGIMSTPISHVSPRSYLSSSISSKNLIHNWETVSKIRSSTGLTESMCVKLYSSAIENARAVSLHNTILGKTNSMLLNSSRGVTRVIMPFEYANYINLNQVSYINPSIDSGMFSDSELLYLKIGLRVCVDVYTTNFMYTQFCNGYRDVFLSKEIVVEDIISSVIGGNL